MQAGELAFPEVKGMMELLFGLGSVWFVGLILSVVLGCLAAVVASQKNLATLGVVYSPGCLCCRLIGIGFLSPGSARGGLLRSVAAPTPETR